MKNFYITGEITSKTLKDFVDFLQAANNEPITIYLNSAGGDVFAALGISNLIKSRNVSVEVVGLAASAATLICSGGNVRAAKNSVFMIHSPLVGLVDFYNADELAKVQTALDAVKNAIITTYTNKIKLTVPEIETAMKNETYLSAEQAKQIGLVDEISESVVEMKLSDDKKFVLVNNLQVPAANFPANLIPAQEQPLLMEKFKQSILTVERGRVAALLALKNDSPAVNSIINKAIETGKTAEEIQPLIAEIKPNPADSFYKMLKDNLNSGAEKVGGSIPADKDAERTNYIENVAKFANEILSVKCRV